MNKNIQNIEFKTVFKNKISLSYNTFSVLYWSILKKIDQDNDENLFELKNKYITSITPTGIIFGTDLKSDEQFFLFISNLLILAELSIPEYCATYEKQTFVESDFEHLSYYVNNARFYTDQNITEIEICSVN